MPILQNRNWKGYYILSSLIALSITNCYIIITVLQAQLHSTADHSWLTQKVELPDYFKMARLLRYACAASAKFRDTFVFIFQSGLAIRDSSSLEGPPGPENAGPCNPIGWRRFWLPY